MDNIFTVTFIGAAVALICGQSQREINLIAGCFIAAGCVYYWCQKFAGSEYWVAQKYFNRGRWPAAQPTCVQQPTVVQPTVVQQPTVDQPTVVQQPTVDQHTVDQPTQQPPLKESPMQYVVDEKIIGSLTNKPVMQEDEEGTKYVNANTFNNIIKEKFTPEFNDNEDFGVWQPVTRPQLKPVSQSTQSVLPTPPTPHTKATLNDFSEGNAHFDEVHIDQFSPKPKVIEKSNVSDFTNGRVNYTEVGFDKIVDAQTRTLHSTLQSTNVSTENAAS